MADKKRKPDRTAKKPYVSIILPVYNEEDNILLQYKQIKEQVSHLKTDCEVIFIDDGSIDNSYKILKDIALKDKNLKLIQFRRNFGQTAAIAAGIDHSSGKIIIIMDSDLQNDAEDIKNFINKIEEGYDVVSGWRKERKDKFFSRKVLSRIANIIISKVSKVSIHDLGSSQAYRGDLLRQIKLYGEMHRFIPIHASWLGAKITEIPVKHHPRQFGKSKYGVIRAFKVLLDLTTVKFMGSYSTKPIYFFGGAGIFLFIMSVCSGTIVILMKFFQNLSMIRNPLLLLTVMLIILSIMFILLGILAEILIRIYHETHKQRPYTVREITNL
ncbi:MAG: glycosyltransferase family 2 protein [Spirochaetes bacterium]|nr:glycosyltransferase family 2 protein [Spirochaetota bacterium]